MAKLTFLGTGTSNGVPVIGCDCETCRSKDPRDQRMRSSVFLETNLGTKILIDVGPDFRNQALYHRIHWLDGILVSHSHQDHIGGIDELRQINFIMKKSIEIYGTETTLREIQSRFDYIFKPTQWGGGKPRLELCLVEGDLRIKEQKIVPIPVMHGQISINGYRLGSLAYITDASFISEESLKLLNGIKTLIINALRLEPHPTHFSLAEALKIIERISPQKAYLTHLTHTFLYQRDSVKLPSNIAFAYDGLSINWE
jgi:phosphoribosyl 1,2-cyclic phosphate phosphodiesterase